MEVTITIKAPELAAAIQSLADAIVATGCIPVEIPKAVKEDNTPTEELVQQVELAEKPEKEDNKSDNTVKLEDVRAKVSEVMDAGKRDEIKNLFEEFGVKKLSAVPTDRLPDFLAKVRGL